jgi:hypothetical protein
MRVAIKRDATGPAPPCRLCFATEIKPALGRERAEGACWRMRPRGTPYLAAAAEAAGRARKPQQLALPATGHTYPHKRGKSFTGLGTARALLAPRRCGLTSTAHLAGTVMELAEPEPACGLAALHRASASTITSAAKAARFDQRGRKTSGLVAHLPHPSIGERVRELPSRTRSPS